MFEDEDYNTTLNGTERRAMEAFTNMWGNNLDMEKRKIRVKYSRNKLRYTVAIETYFLHSHTEFS